MPKHNFEAIREVGSAVIAGGALKRAMEARVLDSLDVIRAGVREVQINNKCRTPKLSNEVAIQAMNTDDFRKCMELSARDVVNSTIIILDEMYSRSSEGTAGEN